MIEPRKNDSRPVGAAMTLGAARERLIANGYTPVSALSPDARSDHWLMSEHPAALKTLGDKPLAALILSPPQDTALGQRIRAVLERHALTAGPVRIGSDHRALWPIRADARLLSGRAALDGAVILECNAAMGGGQGIRGALIPLDGAWPRGDLLSVPYPNLPALSSDEALALFQELERLAAPAPMPAYVPRARSRRGPTAEEIELAELRRDPEKLRAKLLGYTGNPAMQQVILKRVRESVVGD